MFVCRCGCVWHVSVWPVQSPRIRRSAQIAPGVQAGVSLDPDQFYFGGHIETSPLVDRLRFRPSVDIGIGDVTTLVAGNFEFTYTFPAERPWNLYVGGGPADQLVQLRRGGSDTEAGFNFSCGAKNRERPVLRGEGRRRGQPGPEIRRWVYLQIGSQGEPLRLDQLSLTEYRERRAARATEHARLARLDARISYARLAAVAAFALTGWLVLRRRRHRLVVRRACFRVRRAGRVARPRPSRARPRRSRGDVLRTRHRAARRQMARHR